MNRLRPLALFVLPLLLWAALCLLRDHSQPFWLWYSFDPDYYYLLNALMLAVGEAPADVFHPGTPVQMVGATVLRLLHPGLGADALIDAVLTDPETHLRRFTDALFLLILLSGALAGLSAFKTFGRLLPALFVQAAPFLSMVILKYAVHAKPEPLTIVATYLLSIAALKALRDDENETKLAIAFGAAIAFGTAVKITFAPLAVLPLLRLRSAKLWAIYATAGAFAFLLFTLPALGQYEIYLPYFQKVFLGSGAYGNGPATIINPSEYPKAFFRLFASKLPMLATLLAALAVLVACRRNAAQKHGWRLLAGLCLAQVAQVAMAAKQPSAHYVIPAILLTGLALALVWRLSAGIPALARRPQRHGRIWALIAILLAGAQTQSFWAQNNETAERKAAALSIDMNRFKGCAIIYFDVASAPLYAFHSADIMSGHRFQSELARRAAPDQYVHFLRYHDRSQFLRYGEKPDLAAVLANYPCAVFRGSDFGPMWGVLGRSLPGGFQPDAQCKLGEETIMTKGIGCAP